MEADLVRVTRYDRNCYGMGHIHGVTPKTQKLTEHTTWRQRNAFVNRM